MRPTMREARIEPELAELRSMAENLARSRQETLTTAHLLAVLAQRPGATADLLMERRLNVETFLSTAARSADNVANPLGDMLARAREIAGRIGVPVTASPHVLVALLGERRSSAHQALSQVGLDVGRLRSAAMNLALGFVGQRRIVGAASGTAATRDLPARELGGALSRNGARAPDRPTRGSALPAGDSQSADAASRGRGVALPVIPSLPRTRRTGRQPSKLPRKPIVPASANPAAPAPTDAPASIAAPVSTAAPAVTATVTAAPVVHSAAAVPSDRAGRPARKRSAAVRPSAIQGLDANRFQLDAQRAPLLSSLGHNLTLAAAQGVLDPVIGRASEIEHALDVLAKRHGNNPILVGPAGVGKTAIVRGIAAHIVAQQGASALDDRTLVDIPIGELLAGTGVRGALVGRLNALKKEVAACEGRVVLCFDDIDQLFAGDAAEELSGELKLALARGELPCIGTATREAYAKAIESDPALARRFTVVEVEEPSREDAFLILEGVAQKLAAHHGTPYSTEALALAVNFSVRYLPGRALPDKAVSVLDLAGARARRRGIDTIRAEMIADVVSELADVPLERLLETDGERMLRLEQHLAERVVGHQSEIHRICRILRRNAAGLSSRRPLGTFLLLGPTGVGKTETAKALAEVLFENDNALTRIDLNEYGEPHSVARLLGAPPGYVGHDAGGQLTEAVRRRPYQVILLDEIEKAHPDVLLSLLGLLDEGRLTDGRGRTVDFTNTVVLMTSNLGAEASGATRKRRVGFGSEEIPRAELETGVVAAARDTLPPELYNRIDEILVFSPLARAEVQEIARRTLVRLGRNLEAQRGVLLSFDDAALEALLDAGGYDPSLGARPLRRTVARLVEAPLAELILRGELQAGDTLLVEAGEDGVVLDIVSKTASRP